MEFIAIEIAKLQIKEGDILAVGVNGMTKKQQEIIIESLKKIIPKGSHIFCVSDVNDLKIITPTE